MLDSSYTRLVAFGCSITYGHGLHDCVVNKCEPGKSPSKYAWPQLVADQLGIMVDNQSKPGASNLEILHRILNYKFKERDYVTVMWTYPDRDYIFGNKNLITRKQLGTQLGSWQTGPILDSWLSVHTESDLATRSWLNVHHANLFLNSINVPVYNFFVSLKYLKKYKPLFVDVPYSDIKVNKLEDIDRAADNLHPGIKSHTAIANAVIKVFSKCK